MEQAATIKPKTRILTMQIIENFFDMGIAKNQDYVVLKHITE